MLPKMNPKQMEKMMRQLGMQTQEIPASRVVIESDGVDYEIVDPSVSKISMGGQETFQITGELREIESSDGKAFSQEDIELIAEKTGCSKEEAKDALKETGDLTEAILKLQR